MIKFILKRLLNAILTLLTIVTITFLLIKFIPGNPIAKMAEKAPKSVRESMYLQYGLDKPILVQYKDFLKRLVFQGDLGESIKYPGRKVSETISKYGPVSGKLGAQALTLGLITGILLGLLAAINRGTWPDFLVMLIAVLGISVPSFIIASVVQYFLAIKWKLFPITGWEGLAYTILPSLALSFSSTAKYARYMRANCLDIINQDYILTAKAKGASKGRIIIKHILRNSFLPIISLLGPQVATLFGGSFVIEKIFSIPGLGSYFVSSVQDRDYTMVMGQTIFISFLYIISLLVVDILYALIDPRIKLLDESNVI